MRVKFWAYEWEVGGPYLAADLRDSNDILSDGAALRQRLDDDGYLLIRELRERDVVLEARRAILRGLERQGALAAGTPLSDGVIGPSWRAPATTGVRGNEQFRSLPELQKLFRMPEIMQFFDRLLGGNSGTFDFQWLRIAGTGAASPIHSDIVFMGRGTQNLFTCWTPLGDVYLNDGPIVLLPGSQHIDALEDTYWKADVDRDLIEGHFSKDPLEVVERYGGRWATTEFRAGDVLIFGMRILHASLANSSNRFRISVDTRYQLASEEFDVRWMGDPPPGHYNFWRSDIKLEPLEESRRRWNV